MPGLVRGVARTAVVAGTATAVSNRVSRRQAARWSQEAPVEQQPVDQEPADQEPSDKPPQAAPAPAASATDRIAALKDLAELQEAGILTPEEFELEKARVLAS